ncbi:MAG: transposase family protein [Chthoniobacteraceae bacterium]|nr:transposase family protein [Chthoniobacteraceae bacterium]
MKSVTRKRYTSEFKAQAVELVSLGKRVPEVAQDLGIGTSILYGWVRHLSQPAQLGSKGLRAVGEEPEADELRRLRRENANLKLENDILKKAAVILGTKPQPGVAR